MKNLAHNLASSAGAFQLPKLCINAKQLENSLEELISNVKNVTPNQEQKNNINKLLELIKEQEIIDNIDTENPTKLIDQSNIIYILDSDKDFSLGLSKQLQYFGCNARVVNDAASITKNQINTAPLAILIDFDFAEQLLGSNTVVYTIVNELKLTCPIIVLSSHDDFDSRMSAVKFSSCAYFTKPIDINLLIERIHVLTNANIVEPYRVLVLEDDLELANYHALLLECVGIRAYVETNPAMLLNRILQVNPELVIMDLSLPIYNGVELVKLIRQHQSFLTLPIIAIVDNAVIDPANDCLIKPVEEKQLLSTALNMLQHTRYMNASVTKDSLTGLYVHKKIVEYLDIQLKICKRYKRMLSCAIIDIDNFRAVNDTYGHQYGDNVLVTLSNLLKSSMRVSDFVGRYGGEKFVVVFTETADKAAFETLERLREQFSQIAHYADDAEFKVTFSAGIANFPAAGDVDQLMAYAEKAVYSSKVNGRNKITIWDKHL